VKSVFVDTSRFYAVLERDDSNHSRARAIWERFLPESNLVTNNYVLVETTALVQRRLGMAALRAFVNDILPVVHIEWISEQSHRAALEAVLASARRNLSLVDCVSFQTMRECGLDSAFCFDAHFHQQGFHTL
jgi:predicted nucleic acid-binding protein